MPPIATTPIAISTPVRIRFFNFDLGVLLISILLYNFTRAVTNLVSWPVNTSTIRAHTVFHPRLLNRCAIPQFPGDASREIGPNAHLPQLTWRCASFEAAL